MDELSKRLLDSLLDGDVAAGMALCDRLTDCGDHVRAAKLGHLLGTLAERTEDAWRGVPANVEPRVAAWDNAVQTVTDWDNFAQEVRRLFWVLVASEYERKRFQWLLSLSQELAAQEFTDEDA